MTMSSIRRMIVAFATAAVVACLFSCDQEKASPAPTSASASAPPVASTPPATPSAPAASAVERKPVHPCPDGSVGKGTLDDPCKATGKSRMMTATWDKKIGDKGPTFKIINNSKLEILYGNIVIYFYDKAGKQIEIPGGDKPRHRLMCAGDIFAGAVKAGEKVFMNFSCAKKDDVPKGTKDIEAEIRTVGFTDDAGKADTFWRNDDLTPDERPKGGNK